LTTRAPGASLFRAVFGGDEARRLAERFLDAAEAGRLLTVSRDHPTVLAQPWELLRDPKGTSRGGGRGGAASRLSSRFLEAVCLRRSQAARSPCFP
jgi:hypothetical protein